MDKKRPSLSSKLKARMERDKCTIDPPEADNHVFGLSGQEGKRSMIIGSREGPNKKQFKADIPTNSSPVLYRISTPNPDSKNSSVLDIPLSTFDPKEHVDSASNEEGDRYDISLDDIIASMGEKKTQNKPSTSSENNECNRTDSSGDQIEHSGAKKSTTDEIPQSTHVETDCSIDKDSKKTEGGKEQAEASGSVDSSESGLPKEAPTKTKNKENMRTNFEINLTQEAKDLIRDLAKAAIDGKPPTVSKLKWLTVGALEQIIRYNDRPVYQLGSHSQLAAVVADYMKNGVPPRCPKCEKGALRFSNGKKKNGKRYYWCPGFSPNGYHFFGCNFKAAREDITREPFKYPE